MEHVEWYIVFTDEDVSEHWLYPALKEGFQHCYCFRQIGDHIFYANPTISNIDSKVYQNYTAHQLAKELTAYTGTKILRFKYPFDINNRMFNIWNLVPTCVSVVKMFLGISGKSQTPYQLYKHLLARGAVPFNH